MELLLWLYLYDNRWFFDIKIHSKFYKILWIVPIFIHFMLFSMGIYYLNFVDDFQCTNSLKMWILHRTFFSVLIIINIIIFLIKIQSSLEKEKIQFNETNKILGFDNMSLNSINFNSEQKVLSFWVRRHSLISTPGILLLIQEFNSLYYSYLIKNLLTNQSFGSCDYKIQKALNIHSYSIWYGNILLIVILATMIKIKVFHFIMGMYFPNKYVFLMRLYRRYIKNKKFSLFKFNLLGLFQTRKNLNNSKEMEIINSHFTLHDYSNVTPNKHTNSYIYYNDKLSNEECSTKNSIKNKKLNINSDLLYEYQCKNLENVSLEGNNNNIQPAITINNRNSLNFSFKNYMLSTSFDDPSEKKKANNPLKII